MSDYSRSKTALAALAGAFLLLAAPAAQARTFVGFNFGFGFPFFYPAPAYYAPAPVYYAPPRVVYAPPAYGPAPSYYAPPAAQPAQQQNCHEYSKTIEIGGKPEHVQAAHLVNRVQPVYPPLARQTRISGTVKLHAIIGKNGAVEQLQVVSGHPLLVQSALDAVRQWRYQPTLLNGEPVEVDTEIDVIFSLAQ